MPRVNHDANKSRLIAKYGAKKPGQNEADDFVLQPDDRPRWSNGKPMPKNKWHKIKPKKTWIEIHREHQKWKKTDDYVQWQHKQFLKQGGTCFYCDEPIRGGIRINDEHVIPKSKGGDNRRSNLVLACSRCNKEKGTKIIPKAELAALYAKNKKKRGTYHKLKEEYPTEAEIAIDLFNRF